MESFWTSKKAISGLRHFVLVNETREKEHIFFYLVSVLDVEINLKISYEELVNSENWQEGWIDLSKTEAITRDYIDNKSIHKGKEAIKKFFIHEDSLFNIS